MKINLKLVENINSYVENYDLQESKNLGIWLIVFLIIKGLFAHVS
jgi:hypothetical protein